MTGLSHREARPGDVPLVCAWPRSADELFFLFPRATFPLTADQLSRAMAQRFDSTVVLLDGEPAGFAAIEPRVDARGDRVALEHLRLGAEAMARVRGA